MKARVKVTGEIVEVKKDGPFYNVIDGYEKYYEHELDFQDIFDYWDKLFHQYAGMAMQGILSCPEWNIVPREGVSHAQECALQAQEFAHALIQKLKEKEERK